MSLPELCLRRPVGTAMASLAVAVLGAVAFVRLPVGLLPDLAFPVLTVFTVYPGAAPAEVERSVTRPLEERVGQVAGVRSVSSRSREARSVVRLRFHWGTDMDFAALHVRERLERLADELPSGSHRPLLFSADPTDRPVLTLAVTGRDLLALRELCEAVFERRLEQLEGVARAVTLGGPRREIRVVVDPDRLRARGLRLGDVARALDRANYAAPGGTVRRGRLRYSLRTLGRFDRIGQLRRVAVRREGSPDARVRLSEIADVSEGFAEAETLARYRGEPAVTVRVFEEAGSNSVRVAERVRATLARLGSEYPGVEIAVASSRATFVRDAVAGVVQALLVGGLLSFAVLFVFLGDPRYPLAVGAAIPLSLLATLALCDAFGVGLNVISLGGLALGIGMLVDNSIVVVENISRHEDEGASARTAAAAGTREVTAAVAASTLTTVAVFGPVLSVRGVAGELFADLSAAVAFSLLASLGVALTLLPVLVGRTVRSRKQDRPGDPPQADAGSPLVLGGGATGRQHVFHVRFRSWAARYESALSWCLAHRAAVVAAAGTGLAVAVGVGAALPRTLMPTIDEGRFRIELELPAGTPLERTDRTVRALEEILDGLDGVAGVYALVGRARETGPTGVGVGGLHRATLEVQMGPGAPPTARVARRFRAAVRGRGLPRSAVRIETGRTTSLGRALAPAAADLEVRVRGPRPPDSLAAVAESVRARIADVETLRDVRLDYRAARPELTVEVLRDETTRHALTVREVADEIEAALRGVATERPFTRFADAVPVRVRVPDRQHRRLPELLALTVRGVPLRYLVRVRQGPGPVEILRDGQTRAVSVLADVDGGLGRAVSAVRRRLDGLERPGLTAVRVAGANDEVLRSFRSLLSASGLALFLVYLVLAGQFESLIQPVVVLAAVPLAGVGAVLLLWATGSGMNLMSGIGLLVLLGIVVNDAIVKVDFINQRRRTGMDKRRAILEAGRLRLRPILMTTVTTVLGLAPLALGWGAGAELRAPLAVAAIGGLLSATVLTLFVVPVVYSLVVEPAVPVAGPVPGGKGRAPGEGNTDDPRGGTDRPRADGGAP